MYIDDNSILTHVQYHYNYVYRPAASESSGVMLNDIRQTDSVKESNENANNDYELLDKYSQAADHDAAEVRQNPQPKQQHGDYKLTQCLAYVPVTHGNKRSVTEATSGGVRGQYMDKADTLDTEIYAVI